MFRQRRCGILLHITSLPSPYGIGDMGGGARRFVDFLSASGQSYWQILPLNPTSTVYGNSPYSSFSAFAGNPLLISPEILDREGLFSPEELGGVPVFSDDSVDYEEVSSLKSRILSQIFEKKKADLESDALFVAFAAENSFWLEDYALFVALKEHFNGSLWVEWPEDVRYRRDDALNHYRHSLAERILKEKFLQFLFFRQWLDLRKYCNERQMQIIGDIPIYVNYDSADVWSHPDIFKLDHEKRPVFVAGVPPDYFSDTGQLWGNPVYDWDALKGQGYAWWIRRFEHNLKMFDVFRIDHFRGLVAYWEVAAGEETAINGKWVEAPVDDFFKTLFRHFPYLPVIAEDLGVITPDVREAMSQLGLPGMKLLIFAFGDNLPVHPYAPHNFVRNCVVYTGTHDNNTIKGWLRHEAGEEEKRRFFEYLGRKVSDDEAPWEMTRLLYMSVANVVIIPMQDILHLGEEARMNFPSRADGNWKWRLQPNALSVNLATDLYDLGKIYGRI